jgi:anti-sigma factor RsiW
LLGAHVLGALDRRDVRIVERHLRECALCCEEHARLSALPRLLDAAAALQRNAP